MYSRNPLIAYVLYILKKKKLKYLKETSTGSS